MYNNSVLRAGSSWTMSISWYVLSIYVSIYLVFHDGVLNSPFISFLGNFFFSGYLIYLVKSWKISSVPDVYDRQCMVVPENEYSTLVKKIIYKLIKQWKIKKKKVPVFVFLNQVTQKEGPSCPHFECWESQLTTVSKANLTWMYNQFREEIASKEGLSTVLKIVITLFFLKKFLFGLKIAVFSLFSFQAWHWSLEKEAVDIIRDCPNQLTATLETRDVAGLGEFF